MRKAKCFPHDFFFTVVESDEISERISISVSKLETMWLGDGADIQAQWFHRLDSEGGNFELVASSSDGYDACIRGMVVASLNLVPPTDPLFASLTTRHRQERKAASRRELLTRLDSIELSHIQKALVFEQKLAGLEEENQLFRSIIQSIALPLDLQVPAIASGAAIFKRSSAYSGRRDVNAAQLHSIAEAGHDGGWSADSHDREPWIEMASDRPRRWYGFATQGRHNADQWVTKISISYATNPGYEHLAGCVNIAANSDRHRTRLYFFKPVTSPAIRVHCNEWVGQAAAMRLEGYFIAD